jgi:hypothetical protein
MENTMKKQTTYPIKQSVLIKNVRLHYASILEPYLPKNFEGARAKYSITGAFEKGNKENEETLKFAMEKVLEVAQEHGSYKKIRPFYSDGDLTEDPITGEEIRSRYPGCYRIRSSSAYFEEREPYFRVRCIINGKYVAIPRNKWHVIGNGSLCHISVKPAFYKVGSNVGATSFINEIIFIKQGEPFGDKEVDASTFDNSELDPELLESLGIATVLNEPVKSENKVSNVQKEVNDAIADDLLAA